MDSIITFATLAPLFMIAAELSRAPVHRLFARMSDRQFALVQKAMGPFTVFVVIGATALVIASPATFNQVLAWILVGFLVFIAVAVALAHWATDGQHAIHNQPQLAACASGVETHAPCG